MNYIDKLRAIESELKTQPVFTDQTKIPNLGSPDFPLPEPPELQQVRGWLGDLGRLRNTPPPALDPSTLSISQLFNAIRIKLGL